MQHYEITININCLLSIFTVFNTWIIFHAVKCINKKKLIEYFLCNIEVSTPEIEIKGMINLNKETAIS